MLQIWGVTKGYIAGAVAFVACPCHLPVTLPLLIALTAGTAFGGWLANNTAVIYITSFVLFIGGLFLVGKWLIAGEAKTCAVDAKAEDFEVHRRVLAELGGTK